MPCNDYVQHKDVTGDDLHIPKTHVSSHEVGGLDEISALNISFYSSGMTSTNIHDSIVEAFNNMTPLIWGNITGTVSNQLDLVTYLDLGYLRLDASNSPVTEDLTLNKDLTVEEDIYAGRDIFIKPGQKVYLDYGE